MHVENPIYKNPLFDKHFAASVEAGLTPNPDFNDWSRCCHSCHTLSFVFASLQSVARLHSFCYCALTTALCLV